MAGISAGASINDTPGIYTREIDLTTSVPAGASSTGAIAGLFNWGPVGVPRLIGNEDQLRVVFGPPSNDNFETWFTTANFLAYGNEEYVVRAANTSNNTFSAVANITSFTSQAGHTIENSDDYDSKRAGFEAGVSFIAKYPGALGNTLKISTCASADQFQSNVNFRTQTGNTSFNNANTKMSFTVGSNTAVLTFANSAALSGNTPSVYASAVLNQMVVGDTLLVGNTTTGQQFVKITAISSVLVQNTSGANSGWASANVSLDQPVKLSQNVSGGYVTRKWEYSTAVSGAPTTTYKTSTQGNTAANDGIHVVIVDEDGKFSGRQGAILEAFENLSRATDSVSADNTKLYFGDVLNEQSAFVWVGSALASIPTANVSAIASVTSPLPVTMSFSGGSTTETESTVSVSTLAKGYNLFADKDTYNISAVLVGKTFGGNSGEQMLNYIIDNVADVRENIVVYGSPSADVSVNNAQVFEDTKTFQGWVRKSGYAFIDSGYKYMYDKYNDVFRYVPLNGDTAGLSSRTDKSNDPWISPAGFNRGQIKNIIKLSYNPPASEQKELFAAGINNVITFRGDGTYLMGDKVNLGHKSDLDQLGTRKMLNILKTVLSKAVRSLLFEQNDEFTQSRFRSMVLPYLKDIEGRRGLTLPRVVADDSNNTQQVLSNNQFVGDIYFKPAKSIRTIQLNFVADNGNAAFNEITF